MARQGAAADTEGVRPVGMFSYIGRCGHLRVGCLAGGDLPSRLAVTRSEPGLHLSRGRRIGCPPRWDGRQKSEKTLPRSADAWCEEQKWTAWITADHGHHAEWLTVLRVGAGRGMGARLGVIVEFTSLPAEPVLDRIVFVAPDKLRVLERGHR